MSVPKYRAWDVHEKKMFTNDQLITWNGNVYANDSSKLNVDNLKGWSIDEKYLMQFTGLKDKNGKEIYESDIVKFSIDDGFNYCIDEIGIVDFRYGFSGFIVNNQFYLCDLTEIEVIGNFYESPDLLLEWIKIKNRKDGLS